LTGVEERSDGILLTFANGARIEAEFVIGADAVRSAALPHSMATIAGNPRRSISHTNFEARGTPS